MSFNAMFERLMAKRKRDEKKAAESKVVADVDTLQAVAALSTYELYMQGGRPNGIYSRPSKPKPYYRRIPTDARVSDARPALGRPTTQSLEIAAKRGERRRK